MESARLTEREKSVLRYVIHQFILTANPVGSRNIAKHYNLNVSSATIRNIMADLEDFGFLEHPHTSAGRVPTDRGYRFYVDSLMEPPVLEPEKKNYISSSFEGQADETDDILKLTSIILSQITNQLACVSYPNFENAHLERIQILQVSSSRILVVVSVKSGLIRTITLEITSNVSFEQIESVQQLLNEKLCGLSFQEIRTTFTERFRDYSDSGNTIIRLFLDSIDKIFTDVRSSESLFISGTRNIMKQPEFENIRQFQGIIELIEDKDVIVHIMEKKAGLDEHNLVVSIGEENSLERLSDYSLITKKYKFGDVNGSLGIIGPRRMEYSKTIAAVEYIAEFLSNELKVKNKIG